MQFSQESIPVLRACIQGALILFALLGVVCFVIPYLPWAKGRQVRAPAKNVIGLLLLLPLPVGQVLGTILGVLNVGLGRAPHEGYERYMSWGLNLGPIVACAVLLAYALRLAARHAQPAVRHHV